MASKIFVTGASGFVGRNLVSLLLQKGYSVSAWSHHPGTGTEESDRVSWKSGDLSETRGEAVSKLKKAMDGCSAVVHLAAKTSQAPSDHSHAASVNIEGTTRLLDLARDAGIKRFIFMSTQSAKISRPGNYGATKKKAEGLVLDSGLDPVILRPAIIYGPGEAGIFKKFVMLVEKLPMIPIPSTNVRFQPVYIGDVVQSVVSAIEQDKVLTRTFDVAGPDAVTFPQLIRRVADSKRLRRTLIPVPMGLALFGARILSKLMKRPPVTVDNLIGLTEATPIDLEPMKKELQVIPVPLNEGLRMSFNPAQADTRTGFPLSRE